jgi:endonuclease-3 related protein
MTDLLHRIYRRLFAAYGPQHWWPAREPFEVMVGAILTQNAAWPNVERAIANLKQAGKLSPRAILDLPLRRLQQLLKPSGFFRVKAKRLKSFVTYFQRQYAGSIARMRRVPLARLRPELLAVHGVGRETADSILLYALNKPTFVIDAYTRRILSRHKLDFAFARVSSLTPAAPNPAIRAEGRAQRQPRADYDDLRRFFESHLPRRVRLYNEYHALLVRLAKTCCRTKPLCAGCPLEGVEETA